MSEKKTITVTLVRSVAGNASRIAATVRGLGCANSTARPASKTRPRCMG